MLSIHDPAAALNYPLSASDTRINPNPDVSGNPYLKPRGSRRKALGGDWYGNAAHASADPLKPSAIRYPLPGWQRLGHNRRVIVATSQGTILSASRVFLIAIFEILRLAAPAARSAHEPGAQE